MPPFSGLAWLKGKLRVRGSFLYYFPLTVSVTGKLSKMATAHAHCRTPAPRTRQT